MYVCNELSCWSETVQLKMWTTKSSTQIVYGDQGFCQISHTSLGKQIEEWCTGVLQILLNNTP